MLDLFGYSLGYQDLAVLMLVGFLIGMAKTGVHGAGMIAVPLLAIIFGGKNSSGLMLPILSFADLFGVWYYHSHAKWDHLKKLLPFAVIGVILGTFFGQSIDDTTFRQVMAIIIFISLGIMIWMERSKNSRVPTTPFFAFSMGILGGVTTMVGNLAGSVMALYLLSMKLPKNQFVGTAAWFFLIINLIKVPFHVVVWKTITWNSFLLDAITAPAIAIGAFLGVAIVRRISEKYYRWFIILMTAIASVFMVF